MPDFIIIDDDPVNNLICTRIIEIVYPGASVKSYTNPVISLEEMRGKYSEENAGEVVVFLDINMPELSGWEVLNAFDTFPEDVKKHFTIFILSSSVDAMDKQKASKSSYVSGYVAKPLSKAILQGIL